MKTHFAHLALKFTLALGLLLSHSFANADTLSSSFPLAGVGLPGNVRGRAFDGTYYVQGGTTETAATSRATTRRELLSIFTTQVSPSKASAPIRPLVPFTEYD